MTVSSPIDAARMRGKRPFGFTDLLRGKGLQQVVDFIVETGGLRAFSGEVGSARNCKCDTKNVFGPTQSA
jgi:hypothetical protein